MEYRSGFAVWPKARTVGLEVGLRVGFVDDGLTEGENRARGRLRGGQQQAEDAFYVHWLARGGTPHDREVRFEV